MEFKKSELEEKLESKGWIFLFNIESNRLNPKIVREGEFPYKVIMATPLITNPDILVSENIMKSLNKIKRDPTKIKVTDTYDSYGKPVYDCRAIYIY